jgi:hypothetical protein
MRKPDKTVLAVAVGRGAALLAGTGPSLGGVAGTVDWPFVGTFFGAMEAAAFGALVGAVDGLVLGVFLSGTASNWSARVVSALLVLVAELVAVRFYRGAIDVPVPVEVVLVLVGVAAGAAAGPLVAYGVRPAAVEPSPAVAAPSRVIGRVVSLGACVGAGFGAVAGFIIGVRTYLPTSPFAAVEGAVFGSVTGLMLACLVLGVAVLPRLRARR